MSHNKITLQEFEKFFTKGIFRRALAKIIKDFDGEVVKWGNSELAEELSLGRKLDMYQRRGMIRGINPKAENHKDIRKMLYSLHDISTAANPDKELNRISYDQLLNVSNKNLTDPDVLEQLHANSNEDATTRDIRRFIELNQDKGNKYCVSPKLQHI